MQKALEDSKLKKAVGEKINLVRGLASNHEVIAIKAMRKLSQTYESHFSKLFERLLDDPSPHIRIEALWGLAAVGKQKELEPMSRLLEDKAPMVQREAIRVFGIVSQSYPEAAEYLIRRGNKGMSTMEAKSITRALSFSPKIGSDFELYRGAATSRFMNPKRLIVRKKQFKDGAPVILLGGKLYKKAKIIRISKKSLRAWQFAIKLEIPVEPILMKNGKPRIRKNKDGTYSVSTGIINGVSLYHFKYDYKSRPYVMDALLQAKEIARRLNENGIIHNHLHQGNFVVEMVEGKPKVYVIDFDAAHIARKQ